MLLLFNFMSLEGFGTRSNLIGKYAFLYRVDPN